VDKSAYMLKNQVQLITYPGSLGANLKELYFVLDKYFADSIGGVHILPFYPSSSDRGFCPLTYDEVDQNFGTWSDIQKIADNYDLVADFIPNHISSESVFYKHYTEFGPESKYADLFLQIHKIFPANEIPAEDLAKIYLRKLSSPERKIQFTSGGSDFLWQTFESPEQIDLDINSLVYRGIFGKVLKHLARNNIKLIRLDAVGYVIKKAGTSCFMVEPEVLEFLDWVKDQVKDFDIDFLVELHSDYKDQLKIASKGYFVYDFCLPFLTLNALQTGQSQYLLDWLSRCPKNQITTLDTHDGIPVADVLGILPQIQIDQTVDKIISHGANINYNYSGTGEKVVYQLDITYFSALGENEKSYLLARAIQFFTPGIPQVYYVGALAGRNDQESLDKFRGVKEGAWSRDINRHNYSLAELEREMSRPIVQKILKLMHFRSHCQAFDGEISLSGQNEVLVIEWSLEEKNVSTRLEANLKTHEFKIYEDGKEFSFVE
jgi:sucrose phosphorylase